MNGSDLCFDVGDDLASQFFFSLQKNEANFPA